jgi:hypothetical protein
MIHGGSSKPHVTSPDVSGGVCKNPAIPHIDSAPTGGATGGVRLRENGCSYVIEARVIGRWRVIVTSSIYNRVGRDSEKQDK